MKDKFQLLKSRQLSDSGFTFIELMAVIIIIVIFIYFLTGNLFEKDDPNYIKVTKLPQLTEYSRQILESKEYVIVPEEIQISPVKTLQIEIEPIKKDFFSERQYTINPYNPSVNQLLAEIKFITDFGTSLTDKPNIIIKLSRLKWNTMVSFVRGIWDMAVSIIVGTYDLAVSIVKGIFNFFEIIFTGRSIDTAKAIGENTYKTVKNVAEHPRIIIEKPVEMASSFVDEVERDIAKRYHIDPQKICLQETLPVLRLKRNIEVGGQTTAFVASFFVPGMKKIPAKAERTVAKFDSAASGATKLSKIDQNVVQIKVDATSGKIARVQEHGLAEVNLPDRSVDAVTSFEKKVHVDSNTIKNEPVKIDSSAKAHEPFKTKETFYPQSDNDLRKAGFDVVPEQNLRGAKNSNGELVKPLDAIITKDGVPHTNEKKTLYEYYKSSALSQDQPLKHDYLKDKRREIRDKINNGEINSDVAKHEIFIEQADIRNKQFQLGEWGSKQSLQHIPSCKKSAKNFWYCPNSLSTYTIELPQGPSNRIKIKNDVTIALKSAGKKIVEFIEGENSVTYVWQ